MIIVFDSVEKMWEGEKINSYHHFLHFQQSSLKKVVKTRDCLVKAQPIKRRQNFRLVHTEINCRRHFKVHLK